MSYFIKHIIIIIVTYEQKIHFFLILMILFVNFLLIRLVLDLWGWLILF